MKKLKIDRIISVATLLASVVAIFLVLKKPAPVAVAQPPAAIAAHAQSFDQKMADFQSAVAQSSDFAADGWSRAARSDIRSGGHS